MRIEDIDTARSREEFVAAIFEDLAWLGLTWESPVLRQSQHFTRYRDLASQLSDMGLLYPCFATRTEIALAAAHNPGACDPDGVPLYSGLHKGLMPREIARRYEHGEAFALRLDMDKALSRAAAMMTGQPLTFIEIGKDGHSETVEAHPERWGDAIIVRKDTPSSYHLAVVADDALQGVTLVTRGRDLLAATGLHRLLQVLLQLPAPQYSHHRLLLGDNGRKLAKSAGDTSLRSLRGRGWTLNDVHDALQLSATVAVEQSSQSR